jgi:hypothetical protein
MKLVSFGGELINDGENYSSSLAAAGQTPAEVTPELVGRTGAAPALETISRPERYLVVRTYLNQEGDKRTLQQQWYYWFTFNVARPLVAADDDGTNERYVTALPVAIVHSEDGDGWDWETLLVVDGDVDAESAWRSTATTVYNWNITASGETLAVVNGAEGENLDAYPTIRIAPNEAGGGSSNPNAIFARVLWRADVGATNYPVNITAGGLDTRIANTNFYSATGDDIRVFVDGVDTDYWLNGINTANTSIWVNLSFQPEAETALGTALDTGTVTTIAAGDMSAFPSQGILLIDSELFVYTGKTAGSFTGVTRAQKGTSAASHSAAAAITWVQHDISIEYGNDTTTAKVTDDSFKPVFSLASSTNTSWVYADFYEEGANRSGAWAYQNLSFGLKYGGNQGASATVFAELGMELPYRTDYYKIGTQQWFLFNPCGITAANFTNGEVYVGYQASAYASAIRQSANGSVWATVYAIPAGSNQVWASWSYNNAALAAGTRYLAIYHVDASSPYKIARLECADVTVSLDSNNTPAIALSSEIASSRVAALVENETTGESIEVVFSTQFGAEDSIVINADRYAVTLERDGSSQYGAVTPDAMRRYLLRLAPGSNTIKYTDEGLVDVDVTVQFVKRYLV